LPLDEAVAVAPQLVVNTLRDMLPPKYRFDAAHHDLLRAAKNPEASLTVSRLSALQLFPVESVQDMPEGYAGDVLAPVNWVPSGATFMPPAE